MSTTRGDGIGRWGAFVCGESRFGPFPRRRRGRSGIAVWKAAQADESPTDARFADVAAALQSRTEDALLALRGG